MMHFQVTGTTYMVFEKLTHYYDDNDSAFVMAFDYEKDANDYVRAHPQHSYYVVKEHTYKIKR